MATFLDRPFGGGKQPTEADCTVLLSYQAFSRTVARQRLELLAIVGLVPDQTEQENLQRSLDSLEIAGIPASELSVLDRPVIVSLADAMRVADDFVLLRTTAGSWKLFLWRHLSAKNAPAAQPTGAETSKDYSLRRFWAEELQPFKLGFLSPFHWTLVLRDIDPDTDRPRITIYDSQFRRRMILDFDPSLGYRTDFWGNEYPVSPLRVVRVWEDVEDGNSLREHDLSAEPILLGPTWR
jgi:hypothetical protein